MLIERTMELTLEQIERQDFVDNAIYDLLNEVAPSDHEIPWNIEMIGDVRDIIQTKLVERGICTAQEFYPFIEE